MFNASVIIAALRYIGASAGSVAAVFVTLGFLDPATSQGILDAIHQITAGFEQVAIGISALIPIISGLYGAWSATRGKQIAAVANNPEVEKIVLKDKAAADAIPSPKVTSK